MNYRIDRDRQRIINTIDEKRFGDLWPDDQLLREIKTNRAFRLRSFMEGPLNFAPTYKYDRRSTTYDSSEKKRRPAWCDRVLWWCRNPARVQQLHYRRYEANVSDHRPISSAFRMTVKSINAQERDVMKTEVEGLWLEKERTLLEAAYRFYYEQDMI